MCADLRIGQEFGEGIRRMFEELGGLVDPCYRQTALRESGRLPTGEVSELIGLARPATIRRLNVLRDARVIDWVGTSAKDPRAFWRLSR